MLLFIGQKQGWVIAARDNVKRLTFVSQPNKAVSIQLDCKLIDTLFGDAEPYSQLVAPHRVLQRLQQAFPATTWRAVVATLPVGDGSDRAGSAALGRMPPPSLVAADEAETFEFFQRGRCLRKIEPRGYRDAGFAGHVMVKCLEARELGFRQHDHVV